ncbi:MAG: hydroxyacid dehydrogenase [Firmicutes bacterium]|nr:hydroxyacid dehydrogenase [Bacillota bacterium]
MKKKVLYIQAIHAAGMDMLREKYDVVCPENEDKAFLLEAVKDASAIVTRLTVVDKDIIAAGEKLEAIAKNGVGVDNIDVEAASARKIAVLTTGPANSLSVAEHTIFAMGAMLKKISYFDRAMHEGNWKCRDGGGFYDAEGRTIGIAGLGRIGRHVAEIASVLKMRVVVYDPFLTEEQVRAAGYEYAATFEELLAAADVLTLHMPGTKENEKIINRETLALMKPGALLINFARGVLVDEDALYEALTTGKLAGAALDAFTPEPPNFAHPLYQLDNVLLSPHTGGISEDARRRMSINVAKGIDAVLEGREPEFCVNKEFL